MVIPVILFLYAVLSCQKEYKLNNLDNHEKIPVINGTITNGNEICSVQLSWASPFDNQGTEYISNAVVILEDTHGNMDYLTPTDLGKYSTSPDGITRQVGEKYKIQVQLEGETYETPFELIPEPIDYDSLYPEYERKREVDYNIYGKVITKYIKGIKIMHQMGKNIPETKYFRFRFRVLAQYLYTNITLDVSTAVYIWQIFAYNNSATKYASVSPDQIAYNLNKYESIFLTYNLTEMNCPKIREDPFLAKPDGWVIETTLYTYNSTAYEYYAAIESQINAGNKIFDPIPSQIQGNLTCISDSSKLVFGMIEFSTKTIQYQGIYWDGLSPEIFGNIRLDNYQIPYFNGLLERVMPDFYINFHN